MGNLVIISIDRNVGAVTQEYRIEYRADGGAWTAGPTLTYDEAQQQPAGLLPLILPIGLPADFPEGVYVRIVTLCRIDRGFISTPSSISNIEANTNPCE